MSLSNQQIASLIQKAQIDTALGGVVAPQQRREFIDLSIQQTAILQVLRVIQNIQSSFELHDIMLGDPVTVSGTEGTAPADADVTTPTITKPVLQPSEIIAAFDVTFDMIRQNITQTDPTSTEYDGSDLNRALNNLFSKRMGKDIVLMAFQGDTSITGSTRMDKALKHMDGFTKLLSNDSTVHDVSHPADPTYAGSTGLFSTMLNALPKDYREDRSQLSYFVSQNALDSYEDEITDRATAGGDQVMFGDREITRYKRIAVRPVYGFPDNKAILTMNRNLSIGYGRRMEFGIDVYNRSRTVEVTITGDVDAEIVRGDAAVLAS